MNLTQEAVLSKIIAEVDCLRDEEEQDKMVDDELMAAADCYIAVADGKPYEMLPANWPFAPREWEPREKLFNLVRGAAYMALEIERMDRANECNEMHGQKHNKLIAMFMHNFLRADWEYECMRERTMRTAMGELHAQPAGHDLRSAGGDQRSEPLPNISIPVDRIINEVVQDLSTPLRSGRLEPRSARSPETFRQHWAERMVYRGDTEEQARTYLQSAVDTILPGDPRSPYQGAERELLDTSDCRPAGPRLGLLARIALYALALLRGQRRSGQNEGV